MHFNEKIEHLITPMFGKLCCRQRVWKPKSLWFGFGEKQFHGNAKLVDPYYGEWEVGTYYSAWRIIKDNRILCGSNDTLDFDELDVVLKKIVFGRIVSLKQTTDCDVRVGFDTGIMVDFLAASSDEDYSFGILHKESNVAIKFTAGSGWQSGPFNAPWKS